MDWIFDNPIGHMYGPYFLLFFISIIIITMIVCRGMLIASDETGDMVPLMLPAKPDIYEIAFLRGNENEVLRLIIFDLAERGYLKFVNDTIERNQQHPDARFLNPLEKSVFDCFQLPQKVADIFKSTGNFSSVSGLIKDYCHKLEEQLRIKHLLMPKGMDLKGVSIWLRGAAVIIGLGAYKLLAAIYSGHTNVGFLIVLSILALFILIFVCIPPRLSKRGKNYLAQLQMAFSQLKEKGRIDQSGKGYSDQRVPALAVAIFGAGILVGTSFDYFPTAFHRSISSGAGGCGTCGTGGSSCSSGGGCGGGGCGGGGCGGCGG